MFDGAGPIARLLSGQPQQSLLASLIMDALSGAARGWNAPEATIAPESSLAGGIGQYLGHVAGGMYGTARDAGQALMGERDLSPTEALGAALFGVVPGRPTGSLGSGIGKGPIRAYHGSPHDFAKFDMSQIGTGEGAQAYGHGLYFAESEPVARSYRNMNIANQPFYIGKKKVADHSSLTSPAERLAAYEIRQAILSGASDPVSAAIARAKSVPNSAAADILEEWQRKGITIPQGGHMYEVNIHADPKSFLDWDKPLAQQHDVLRKIAEFDKLSAVPIPEGKLADAIGSEYYQRLIREHVPATHNTPLGTAADRASNDMRWAGIPGIRYLDQGSRGAGEGTSNYVVFNPDIIEILRKYGIFGTLGGAGAAPFAGGQPQQ